MAEQYDNSNRVALWLNDKREKQTQPHLSGSGESHGDVWASAWFPKDLPQDDAKALMGIIKRHAIASNTPFLSISLKAKDQQAPAQQAATQEAPFFDDDLDNITF